MTDDEQNSTPAGAGQPMPGGFRAVEDGPGHLSILPAAAPADVEAPEVPDGILRQAVQDEPAQNPDAVARAQATPPEAAADASDEAAAPDGGTAGE